LRKSGYTYFTALALFLRRISSALDQIAPSRVLANRTFRRGHGDPRDEGDDRGWRDSLEAGREGGVTEELLLSVKDDLVRNLPGFHRHFILP
jgi:hypothetical protein